MLITELKIANDKDKYNEYLTKVEKVKFEMAEKYLLHPSNYITKKDDAVGIYNLHFHYRRNNQALVDEWDERRMDVIGSNGPTGEHYANM